MIASYRSFCWRLDSVRPVYDFSQGATSSMEGEESQKNQKEKTQKDEERSHSI